MDTSKLLLGFSLIIIFVLVGIIISLSRRRAVTGKSESTGDETLLSDQQVDTHIPAPKLQPEMEGTSLDAPQYRQKKEWLTFQEHTFYKLLRQTITDENLQIFTNARMIDIVQLANYPKDRRKYINLLLVRHIDFIICDMRTQRVLFGLELDDSSHRKYDRVESDKFKDSVFQQIGLPLLRITLPYIQIEVEKQILEILNNSTLYQEGQRPSKRNQRFS